LTGLDTISILGVAVSASETLSGADAITIEAALAALEELMGIDTVALTQAISVTDTLEGLDTVAFTIFRILVLLSIIGTSLRMNSKLIGEYSLLSKVQAPLTIESTLGGN